MTLTRLESFPFDSRYDGYDDDGYPVYDRAVGAKTMRDVFAHFFTDGVFVDGTYPFRLTKASSGLAVTVNPGVAIINGGWGILPEQTTLTLATGTTAGVIKYAVFVRFDNNDEHRTIYLRTDASSAGGAVPEPVTTEANVIEYRIGYITVPSNSANLANATITNEVGTSKCPYATPLFDIDPDEVLEDLRQDAQAAYDKYYALLQSAIDGTTAGHLQNQLDGHETRIAALEAADIDPLELRAAMGLGRTLGPLEEEFGGTDGTSLKDAIAPYIPSRKIKYVGIDREEFKNNTVITSFSDESAESIDYQGFYGCSLLSDVYFPACTTIGEHAFSRCDSLEEIDESAFPLCTSVGNSAFNTNANLETVTLPSCTTFGSGVFQSCHKLSSAYLPSIEMMNSGMFYACPSLKYVKLGGTSTTLTLYPASSVPDYSSFPIYPNYSAGDPDSGDLAIDLHGVKSFLKGSNSFGFLCYNGSRPVHMWIDSDATANANQAYLIYQHKNVHVHTDGSSLLLNASNFNGSTVTYHYNESYETWLATYGM